MVKLRAELSEKNKYYINKHRYYELKHFCLQYPIWKKGYTALEDTSLRSIDLSDVHVGTNNISNPTEKYAIVKTYLSDKINMIEKAASIADSDLYSYILKGVTEEYSYTYLKTKLEIPCSKDTYYDRYRKFFWILSNMRK